MNKTCPFLSPLMLVREWGRGQKRRRTEKSPHGCVQRLAPEMPRFSANGAVSIGVISRFTVQTTTLRTRGYAARRSGEARSPLFPKINTRSCVFAS